MDTRLRYFDIDDPRTSRAAIELWSGDDLIGAIFLRKKSYLPEKYPDPHTPCWQVAGIDVDSRYRRQGFATLLYHEAAKAAARHGMHLCSDVVMSLANEALAFWEKQVQKGRAFWEVPGLPEREGENYDDGRFVLKTPVPASLSGSGSTSLPKSAIERFLGRCLHEAIKSCNKNPALIFSGCPETTQLAARTAAALGLEFTVIQGKVRTWDMKVVDHLWVELPELDLRIETNPSQVLGLPTFAIVLDRSYDEDRYSGQFENMEFLRRVTERGEEFYSKMAEDVARCVAARFRKQNKK